jgi:hypothetical protein
VDWSSATATGFAVALGVIAVAREWSTNRGARSRIKQDLELLALLPDTSPVKQALAAHIERSVTQLITSDDERRRDWSGFSLAVAFAIVTFALANSALDENGWTRGAWWAAATIVGLLAVTGITSSLRKVRRDERGRDLERRQRGSK